MTAYKDFISDFPRRCHKLLEMADSCGPPGGIAGATHEGF